jgi:hypothetical protein
LRPGEGSRWRVTRGYEYNERWKSRSANRVYGLRAGVRPARALDGEWTKRRP